MRRPSLPGQLHDADRFLAYRFGTLIDRAHPARRGPAEMVKWRFRWRNASGQPDQADAVRPPPRVPEGTRVYAIGDIHGRADLLDRLHALIEADFRANPVSEVRLVYLGDYVDRGPDSAGVIERLITGPLIGEAKLLSGNHEQMLLHFLEDEASGVAWWQLGGLETLRSYGAIDGRMRPETGLAQELKSKLPAEHLTFIQGLEKTATFGDYFFCHAGVRPGVPLESQREDDLLSIRGEFLSSTADFGKVVVHGHTPVAEPEFKSNRINIDTGAYSTGRLTCLVLEGTERRLLVT